MLSGKLDNKALIAFCLTVLAGPSEQHGRCSSLSTQ
jgi:hypothetical protein